MITIRLPRKHAADWLSRYDSADRVGATFTARTVTLFLAQADLDDLIDDAKYYATEMGPEATGDDDYRPAAQRCLAALRKQIVF